MDRGGLGDFDFTFVYIPGKNTNTINDIPIPYSNSMCHSNRLLNKAGGDGQEALKVSEESSSDQVKTFLEQQFMIKSQYNQFVCKFQVMRNTSALVIQFHKQHGKVPPS